MHRFLALSIAVLATFGVRVVLAADAPTTYTFAKRVTWKVGDVQTRTESEKQTHTQKVTMGEQVLQEQANTVETSFESVLEVKEVDAEGAYTKALVYFRRWKRSAGDKVDESLAGAHVEVTGAGAARSAKVVTPDRTLSPQAAQWLDGKFGAASVEREAKATAVLVPTKPVAVGETWNPTLEQVRDMFGRQGGLQFLDAGSTAALTLAGVEGELGAIKLDLHMALGPVESQGGKLEWTEGGAYVMTGTIHRPLHASVHEERGEVTGHIGGKAVGGPVTLALDVDLVSTGSRKSGGEMPALAAPAAVK